jgi:2-dehydropantoate 2-reductase
MQEIQKVAILGAGAMGAYFAERFFHTPGFSTVLVASGPRLDALRRDGIIVNGELCRIPAIDPQEADGPVDFILVALKHHQLEEAVRGLGCLVGEETTFLSVMNGLESEEIIGSIHGMDKVLYAISVGIDAVRAGNRVTYTRPGVHSFGEAQNRIITPKVRRVQQAFDRAGIRYDNPPDMIRMLWWKFLINVGVNQASAVLRAPYGVFHTNSDAQALMESLMQEVLALSDAMGKGLTDQDIRDWYPVMRRLSPQGKTSMLQDIEAGRKTEVDVFGGAVVRLGQQHGVPTPVNQAVVRMIRVMEEEKF